MGDLKYFTEGMRAYREGDYAAAIDALGRLAQREDHSGKLARYYCGMAHRAMGIEQAREGRFDDAAGQLRRAIALIGRKADLVEYLLNVYAKTGQYERCAAEAEILAEGRCDDVKVQVRLAQAQWRSGSRTQAVMTLTRALRRLGDSIEVHLTLGLFHAAEEQLDLARRHLMRAAECDCTSAKAQRYLGLVESARGDFAQAAGAFQRAWALEPEDLLHAYQLCLAADAAARSGRPVQISLPEFTCPVGSSEIRQLAQYVTAEPDFVDSLLALPASQADRELFSVVLSVLRTALTEHPEYADLQYYAGLTKARLGDLDGAITFLESAVRINPAYTKALVQLAEVYARKDRRVEAIDRLQQAVKSGADFPDVHARLGDLLKQSGMFASAKEHYGRALELNGRYKPAAAGLASLAA